MFQVIAVGALEDPNAFLLTQESVMDIRDDAIRKGVNWALEFQPQLVRLGSNGRLFIDTKFTRLLGKPPVMVSGMTPTRYNIFSKRSFFISIEEFVFQWKLIELC
jgi:hypothetical protein